MLITKKQLREAAAHFKYKYGRGCRTPKKGEYYLKPSGTKGVFEVLQAQQDFDHNYYPIIDERYLEYMKKHHLTIED